MTALLCSHPSQESCRPQEELGVIFWVGLFGFWLKDKLHGKAELSILLLSKHDLKKTWLDCHLCPTPAFGTVSEVSQERQGDPGECGTSGSAVPPSQTGNSQGDPGTKPARSEWPGKAEKDVRQEFLGFTQVNHEGKLAPACYWPSWNLPRKSPHSFGDHLQCSALILSQPISNCWMSDNGKHICLHQSIYWTPSNC